MPTYIHQCQDAACNHEWEDYYSMALDPPKICPKCNQETAKRMINSTTKGVVELSGHELVSSIKSDAKKIEKEASQNEYKYASLLGESKYQQMQQSIDSRRRNKY